MSGDVRQSLRLQRRKTTEREERHITNSLFGKEIDERVIATIGDVVEVLDAHHWSDRLRLRNLLGGDITYPKVLNQTGSLHSREHAERFRDRDRRRRVQATNPQIDHIKDIEAEVCQVIFNSFPEFVGASALGQFPFASRRAPTLVTIRNCSGYGCSASLIS